MRLNIECQARLNHECLTLLYAEEMSIGTRIRQLRKANGLSGDKFGELCGVSKGAVSQWESGLTIPPTEKILELHRHLKFSFDWLLKGDDEKQVYSTTDPKLVNIMLALEPQQEFVKDAAVTAVLTYCELAERATAGGTSTHG